MEPEASAVRRRARYHALRGGPPAQVAQGVARTRRFQVLLFQVVALAFLAVRGFPGQRLAVHAVICLIYLAVSRYPAPPITERAKVRMLIGGLLSFGAWLANTGGLSSPLIPLGLGMLLPAMLIFETQRQKLLFAAGGLAMLLAVALLSLWPIGALVAPLAPRGGHPSPEFVVLVVGSILVTASQASTFWAHVAAAYDKVAIELGARREELCSVGEDRTRELEGAAAHLAHEMKNPLASIKCLSAHLARGCSLDAKTVERLEVVSAEADRLESIVDGFVSLSRGLGELTVQRIRPFELARELKLLLDARASDVGVTLELTGRPELEVEGDAKKIYRALFCLLMNAVQASRSGQTVTIDVSPAAPASTSSAPGHVRVRVVDRGEGMSHEVLERLKRPPFSTRKEGAGLGVAVARTLIEQHGGRLKYESVPGQGTTATIDLPHQPPACPAAPKLLPDALRERREAS
ncbi:MAG TPA: HAMP domain-containing sensor histidine kinase [Polyangia bacterium]|jgi:signal transduction histidine kinase|nr:HAMP domain-containing sensor histidine kinase [Polyangia bacterium]